MATEVGQVYSCQVCSNVVKVEEEGAGTLVCCAKPMLVVREK